MQTSLFGDRAGTSADGPRPDPPHLQEQIAPERALAAGRKSREWKPDSSSIPPCDFFRIHKETEGHSSNTRNEADSSHALPKTTVFIRSLRYIQIDHDERSPTRLGSDSSDRPQFSECPSPHWGEETRRTNFCPDHSE